jgi:hypothetical protein
MIYTAEVQEVKFKSKMKNVCVMVNGACKRQKCIIKVSFELAYVFLSMSLPKIARSMW